MHAFFFFPFIDGKVKEPPLTPLAEGSVFVSSFHVEQTKGEQPTASPGLQIFGGGGEAGFSVAF